MTTPSTIPDPRHLDHELMQNALNKANSFRVRVRDWVTAVLIELGDYVQVPPEVTTEDDAFTESLLSSLEKRWLRRKLYGNPEHWKEETDRWKAAALQAQLEITKRLLSQTTEKMDRLAGELKSCRTELRNSLNHHASDLRSIGRQQDADFLCNKAQKVVIP